MKTISIQKALYKTKSCLKRNSPTILSFIAAGGVMATAYFAIQATPKALELLQKAEEEKGAELTSFEKVVNTAPVYIPALIVGGATVFCIFGANTLGKKQQCTLLSAYTLLDSSFKDYRNKTKELLGDDGEFEIRKEIAKDQFTDCNIDIEDDKKLFYEPISGRYFNSTKEDVIAAEYHFNRNFILRDYATLNEFYDFLGLTKTDYGDTVGWSYEAGDMFYGYHWVDFRNEKMVLDDGLECYYIDMPFPPTADFLTLDEDAENTLPIVKGG